MCPLNCAPHLFITSYSSSNCDLPGTDKLQMIHPYNRQRSSLLPKSFYWVTVLVLPELPYSFKVMTESNWHKKGKCSDSSRLGQVKEKDNLLDYQNTPHDLWGYCCFCSMHWFESINKKLWDCSEWKHLLNTAKNISSNHSSCQTTSKRAQSERVRVRKERLQIQSCPGGILQWPTLCSAHTRSGLSGKHQHHPPLPNPQSPGTQALWMDVTYPGAQKRPQEAEL